MKRKEHVLRSEGGEENPEAKAALKASDIRTALGGNRVNNVAEPALPSRKQRSTNTLQRSLPNRSVPSHIDTRPAISKTSSSSIRCGIVLAAGEGKRLRPFIRRLRGDALPKQYVNFLGTRSMLENTFRRAEKMISPEHLFTVVSKRHLSHSEPKRQLSGRASGTVVVQPANKDTGPGLLLPLMHLNKRYPDSTVVVFPSDHFIVEEDLFMSHVEMACHVIERDPSSLVVLGMKPNNPEPEYGYILPGGEVDNLASFTIRKVLRFVEKPQSQIARELIMGGGLWNTMVMVFKAKTLLELVRLVSPALYRSFERIGNAVGSRREREVVEAVYQRLESVNFSRGLMEPFMRQQPVSLLVLPVRGVFWSDWGSEQRIVSTLPETSYLDRSRQSLEHRQVKNACTAL